MNEKELNAGLTEEEILALEDELHEEWLNFIATAPDYSEWNFWLKNKPFEKLKKIWYNK